MPGGPTRVRFAPSPTGYFHVGSARTALFNWLVARKDGGTFVLRIEDTDAARGRDEWTEGIVSALHWLSMDPDEGPYRQSERADRHGQAVDALWAGGYLYACDCTRDEVDARNRLHGIKTPGYDGFCRDRGLDRTGHALRFRTAEEGVTVVEDVVRGRVEFPLSAMDDFVAVKADGAPLFVLANVVDDIDMGITTVIRGEDLLPTTPKGIVVWEALRALGWRPEPVGGSGAVGDGGGGAGAVGAVGGGGGAVGGGDGAVGGGGGAVGGGDAGALPLPVFAHLPMLVNEQRKKLSKRRDPVAVESYRDEGYLPEAFVNYLSLLGWSPPGDVELFGRDELVEWFRLEDVNHSPAFFDVTKLTHMNGEYIRALPLDRFIAACEPWLTGSRAPWPAANFDRDAFARMAPLVQERVAVLGEVPAMVDFLFVDRPVIDPDSWEKSVVRDELAATILTGAIEAYRAIDPTWDRDALHGATLAVGEQVGRKLGKAQAPIRVAVTGRRVGPPLFEALEVLGEKRTLDRLEYALGRIAASAPQAPT